MSLFFMKIFGFILKKRRKKEYEQNIVFHNVWNVKLPWVKSMVDIHGKVHQVLDAMFVPKYKANKSC